VAAVRGTFVIAEVSSGRSTLTILRGLVEVTRLNPATGRPVGPAVKVGALERVIVTGAGPVPAPQAITLEAAKSLASDFTFLPKDTPAASLASLNEEGKKASLSTTTNTVNSLSPPANGTLNGAATVADSRGEPTPGTGTAAARKTRTHAPLARGPPMPPASALTRPGTPPSPLIPPVTPPSPLIAPIPLIPPVTPPSPLIP